MPPERCSGYHARTDVSATERARLAAARPDYVDVRVRARFVSSTRLECSAPPQRFGTLPAALLLVSNNGGDDVSPGDVRGARFLYAPPPSVVSVRPMSGPLDGGTLVSVVVVLWYTGALWYFNNHSLPLLGG